MISFENIDCFEKMKGMEDNSIPLIITDPPVWYIIQRSYIFYCLGQYDDEYNAFIKKFLLEAKRILKEDGTLWFCCARTKIPDIFCLIQEVGLQNHLENWLLNIDYELAGGIC